MAMQMTVKIDTGTLGEMNAVLNKFREERRQYERDVQEAHRNQRKQEGEVFDSVHGEEGYGFMTPQAKEQAKSRGYWKKRFAKEGIFGTMKSEFQSGRDPDTMLGSAGKAFRAVGAGAAAARSVSAFTEGMANIGRSQEEVDDPDKTAQGIIRRGNGSVESQFEAMMVLVRAKIDKWAAWTEDKFAHLAAAQAAAGEVKMFESAVIDQGRPQNPAFLAQYAQRAELLHHAEITSEYHNQRARKYMLGEFTGRNAAHFFGQ